MSKDNGWNSEIQKRIVEFISEYTRVNRFSPTVREVGQAVGLKSSSSAFHHIQILKKSGVIADSGLPRSLTVIDASVCEEHEIVMRHVHFDLGDAGIFRLNCRIEKPRGAAVEVSFDGAFNGKELKGISASEDNDIGGDF